jgi:hypothetical protein
MNYLVIYPGRFHPFHRGHKASYDYLTKQYGENSVYIATSAVQDPLTSPFSYADKVKMINGLGVSPGHVVQVKNPYQATEIVNSLGDEEKSNTVLIFAVSEKDMIEGSARFRFDPKKNGDPSYLQPIPDNNKKLQPMTKHGYVAVTPTVNFRVKGQEADSASAIRKLYRDGNDNDREQIITDLYGSSDPELRAIFDQRLGVDTAQEAVIYGQEQVFAGDNPVSVMREHKLARIQENIQRLKNKIKTIKESRDYIDEHKARKK